MTRLEKSLFAPLVVGMLLLGVYPSLITDVFGPSVENLVAGVDQAVAEARDTGIITTADAAPTLIEAAEGAEAGGHGDGGHGDGDTAAQGTH